MWNGKLDTQMFGLRLLDQERIQPCSHRSLREGAKALGVYTAVSTAAANRPGRVSLLAFSNCCLYLLVRLMGASVPECDQFRVGKAGEECRSHQPPLL